MKRIPLLLKFLATGSFTLLLAACYGVYMSVHRSGSFRITDSDTGEPIEGIKVTYADSYGTDYSDADGVVEYDMSIESFSSSPAPMTVYLQDVDGTENGSYPETIATLDADDSTEDSITLESREE